MKTEKKSIIPIWFKSLLILIVVGLLFAFTGGANSLINSFKYHEGFLRFNWIIKTYNSPDIPKNWLLKHNTNTNKWIIEHPNDDGITTWLSVYKFGGIWIGDFWTVSELDERCYFDSEFQAKYFFNLYRNQQLRDKKEKEFNTAFR